MVGWKAAVSSSHSLTALVPLWTRIPFLFHKGGTGALMWLELWSSAHHMADGGPLAPEDYLAGWPAGWPA